MAKATAKKTSRRTTASRRRAAPRVEEPPPAELPDPVTAYARAVIAREIVAGPYIRLACERHLRDLEQLPAQGFVWNLELANRAIDFFPRVLRLAEGAHAGQPFVLEPFQAFIVGSLFGWIGADGARRFRIAYIEIGKGNGKSPLAAGIGIYLTAADNEASAEVYAAAVTRDQAGILFRDAVSMVNASPALSRALVKSGKRVTYNLAHLRSNSFFRPISSEGKSLDGKRVHGALIDELHEHHSPVVVDKMRLGFKGRRQPLMVEITNSGWDRTSVCWTHHEYSVRILEQVAIDESWFGFVCSLDQGDDWKDESVWKKANPNLDVSVTRKYLQETVLQAIGMPSKQSLVRRLNFCQWVDAEDPWIDRDAWLACETEIDLSRWNGRSVYLGLDLSSKIALTALAAVCAFEDGSLEACLWFWTPADTLRERAERESVPYDAWRSAGYVIATPGKSVEYAFVAHEIREMLERFSVDELAYDRWRMADLIRELDAIGVKHYSGEEPPVGLHLREFGQGFKDMGPAVETMETVVLNQTLKVQRNPALTMCSLNATLVPDPAGNRKFDKRPGKSLGHIDGLVALAMAVRVASLPGNRPFIIGSDYQLRTV